MSICVIVKFETYQIIIVLLDMNLLTCLCSYSAVTMLPYGYLAGKGKGTNSYQLHYIWRVKVYQRQTSMPTGGLMLYPYPTLPMAIPTPSGRLRGKRRGGGVGRARGGSDRAELGGLMKMVG
jgi:hypothetical protein